MDIYIYIYIYHEWSYISTDWIDDTYIVWWLAHDNAFLRSIMSQAIDSAFANAACIWFCLHVGQVEIFLGSPPRVFSSSFSSCRCCCCFDCCRNPSMVMTCPWSNPILENTFCTRAKVVSHPWSTPPADVTRTNDFPLTNGSLVVHEYVMPGCTMQSIYCFTTYGTLWYITCIHVKGWYQLFWTIYDYIKFSTYGSTRGKKG